MSGAQVQGDNALPPTHATSLARIMHGCSTRCYGPASPADPAHIRIAVVQGRVMTMTMPRMQASLAVQLPSAALTLHGRAWRRREETRDNHGDDDEEVAVPARMS